MKRLISKLEELKSLFINNIISKEYYMRELDDLIKYANDKDELKLIHSYRDLEI